MKMASKSKFAMFKGAVAFAWADHVLAEEEKLFIVERITKNIHLTDAQKSELINLIGEKVNLHDVWPQITEKEDRVHLIQIAEDLLRVDGDYHDNERALFEKIFGDYMGTLDVDTLHREMAEMGAQAKIAIEQEELAYIELLKKDRIPFISKIELLFYRLNKALGYE